MDDERYREAWEAEQMVPIFRAPSYDEALAAVETLTNHGLDCTLARETGLGFVQLTDHMASETLPSFAVVVPRADAENARRLVEQLGLVAMMHPAHMAMGRKRWVRGCGGAIGVGFVAFLLIWLVVVVLHLFGWIDF